MTESHIETIAGELSISKSRVRGAADLLTQGATVPFIARYRKEATGSLDEVQITAIRDRLEQLAELDARREAILKSLRERDLLTPELEQAVREAETMARLEDVYLPFRPKRRTRATIAKERGLEPLALLLLEQGELDPRAEAARFVDPDKGVPDEDEALGGARDIIAEMVNEHAAARDRIRALFKNKAVISSKVKTGKEEQGAKFRDYFEWSETAAAAPSHRVLAMFRGENEGALRISVLPPEDDAVSVLHAIFVKNSGRAAQHVDMAVRDGYKRLMSLSLETEMRQELRARADEEAIRVFAENLRELLLAPPLGQKTVLALDPGFRTGCKAVVLDAQGKLLHHDTIYPHTGGARAAEAADRVRALAEQFRPEAIAVGNGTASRETEAFLKNAGLPNGTPIVMVSESGASIYSASDTAREEFPDQDVTVRGSVSIGRRLMDPLAELVKIDPKSIGVGQYQHDVDQKALKRSLDDTVMSCVNAVGVEVNTASAQLLAYVSGLGPQIARNIVAHRDANGAFSSREDLLKVPRLGPKAFEQAAGFLRIGNAANPLDASAVHPESYEIVDAMARDLCCSVRDLIGDEALRRRIDLKRYVTERAGMPTLEDIMNELARPGRDPRKRFEAFSFADGVNEPKDLKPGMKLPGVVTNVTRFGAFVDVGVHQDGLVHVSQLADRFVKDPMDIVKVGQRVHVTVVEVDLARNRISLSMKRNPSPAPQKDRARS
jgi:uncharacterized protein